MQTYFVDEKNWQENEVIISDDAHHIIRVMRYNIGDKILCVHPNTQVAKCNIIAINNDEETVHAKIIEWLNVDNELPVRVTILQSLPKGNKVELIIQKGTELGANQFILFESERSIVKWDEKKVKKRIERYNKIAKEASEQSKRNIIPQIKYVKNINDYLKNKNNVNSIKLIAYEEEAKQKRTTSFSKLLQSVKENEEIIVCIGPEGGFTEEEIVFFKEYGFEPIRLGKRILRTETASLYTLAAISYHFEELE